MFQISKKNWNLEPVGLEYKFQSTEGEIGINSNRVHLQTQLAAV